LLALRSLRALRASRALLSNIALCTSWTDGADFTLCTSWTNFALGSCGACGTYLTLLASCTLWACRTDIT
jgi:hypothetical protein